MSEEEPIKEEGISFYLQDKVLEYFRVKVLLHERLFFEKTLPIQGQASDFYVIFHELFFLIKNNINNGLKKELDGWYGREVPDNDKQRRLYFKTGLDISEKMDKELEKLGITSLNTFGGYIPI